MALTDWNDVIETLAPNASDQALAEAIALGRPHWSLQHSQTHPSNRAIDVSREDRVAVVNEETVLVLGIKELAKLLGSPFGGRMRRQAGRPIGGLSDEAPCRLEARRSACAGGRRSRPVTGEGLPGSERRRYARREPQFRSQTRCRAWRWPNPGWDRIASQSGGEAVSVHLLHDPSQALFKALPYGRTNDVVFHDIDDNRHLSHLFLHRLSQPSQACHND